MTKISKKAAYPIKIPVRKDYFVGTDSENNGKTVNFDFESTVKLINDLNGSPILNYIFRTDSNINLTVLTEGVFLSSDNNTTVSSLTKLYINKNNFHEKDMSDLFRFISVNRNVFLLKIRNSNNLNNSVYFKITGATEYENYFTLDVAVNINNTAVPELINYNVYFFDFELSTSQLVISLPEFNKIVTQTGFTSTGTQITFNPSWVWLLKNVSYTNPLLVQKSILPTVTGNKRIDVFVLNTLNTFQIISGAETTGSPVKPTIPIDTLEVTFCIVGDAGIVSVEPIDLSNYATISYVDEKDISLGSRVTALENAGVVVLDATTTVKGIIKLAGDLAGTSASPTVPALVNKVDKVTGERLINAGEIAKLASQSGTNTGDQTIPTTLPASDVYAWAKATVKPSYTTSEVTEGSGLYFTVARFLANLTYNNVIAALGFTPSTAPNNAQKNSDITKVEIEAKLTGEITSHTHVKNDVISYALSAPTGSLVVGDVDTFHAPYNFTLVSYWIAVKTPPTISSLLVDVKKSGVSITSTKAGIDASEYTSLTGTFPVLTTNTFVKGDPITPVISQIGSGDTGISLKIYLEVIKT